MPNKLKITVISFAILAFSFAYSRNIYISSAIACVNFLILRISQKSTKNRRDALLLDITPELIDHLISGVQSGLSLNESLSSLQTRGPVISRSLFSGFAKNLSDGMNFEMAITNLQSQFSNRSADQLFEALMIAKTLGGVELLTLLRLLGDFTRQDLALRKEISAKQSWIRNSAHLSASAPWILLILLSTQSATTTAFKTMSGVAVLSIGAFSTLIAYLWMGKLSKMPQPRRIFGLR